MAAAQALLDRLVLGVVECDGEGRIRYMNAAAGEALAAADGLIIEHHRLRATDRGVEARLDAALMAAGRPFGPVESALRILRPSGKADWRIVVAPHTAPDDAAVLVLFRDEGERDRNIAARAQALFGLTPSEADLGVRLMQGQSPEESAQARGVSIGTVRTQIKGLMAKTGTRRQAEVAVLLACIPGVRPDGGRS